MSRPRTSSFWGVPIALGVIALWGGHLAFALTQEGWGFSAPLHVLFQAYLFTGLFITGHDAMHRTVSARRWVNDGIGAVACFLFAGLSWRRLVMNHAAHHHAPTSASDPDFDGEGRSFPRWLLTFFRRYVTLTQLLVMAAVFNAFKWAGVEEWRIWTFWVIPSLLGTLQLFYFGTYLPHRPPFDEAMAPHHARSQRGGHLVALLSCYFFGYHWEHHASPGTPWWRLWQVRDARTAADRAKLQMGATPASR